MSSQWCPECGRWLMASHTCPPRWKVTDRGFGNDRTVYANERRFTVRGEMEPTYTVTSVCGTCDGTGVVENVPHMGTMACDPADVRETACPDCGGAS